MSFLKSEVFALFTGGFAIGAVLLFTLQPQEARAEIVQQVAQVTTSMQSLI